MGRIQVEGLPESLEIFRSETSIEIVRQWFNRYSIKQTIILAILTPVFIWILFVTPEFSQYSWSLTAVLLMLSIITILMTWLNKTHILVQRDKVTLQHKPIPWFGNKQIISHTINQIYVKQYERKHTDKNTGLVRKTYSYGVRVLCKNKKEFTLISGLSNHQQALFIEQEVENFLKIIDKEMKNELGTTHIDAF